jgi:Uma2 family endonuclease
MTSTQTLIASDTWIPADWEDFLRISADPAYAKAKAYYYRHHLRLERLPVGFDHSKDHSVITFAIYLFSVFKQIPLILLDNCSYRKPNHIEYQPDVSCYVGDRAKVIPQGTNIVNLDPYPPPDLVVEISKTTLLDDLGTKRSLYESLGIKEYWIISVETTEIIAYQLEERGSYQIKQSQIFSGLSFAILEEALRQSRQVDQSVVGQWLIAQFQLK